MVNVESPLVSLSLLLLQSTGEAIIDSIETNILSDVTLQWCDLKDDVPSGDSNISHPPRPPISNLYKNLRLLCLQSILNDGIRASKFDSIRKLFVQTYGFHIHILFLNLEKLGILRRKEVLLLDTSTSV